LPTLPFLLPLPPPPRPTLFPYTTLFRSPPEIEIIQLERGSGLADRGRGRAIGPLAGRADLAVEVPAPRARIGRGQARLDRALEPDRKSTRLNSSHRTISYAVFCLKKKKK